MSQVGLLSSMPIQDTTANWGFAEQKGEKSTIFDSWTVQARTGQILIATFAVSSVVALTAGVLVATGGLALPAIIALGVGVGGTTLSGGGLCAHQALKSYQSYQKAGMVDTSQAEHMQYWKDNTPSPTEMIPTQHCADTQQWRKKLIESAQHNIVISGNYCGGEAFDEILDLIEKRMAEKPDLKVIVIASPNFIKDETIRKKDVHGESIQIEVHNKTKIAALREQYPDRFSLVESPDVWMVGSTAKKVTNHTKYLGIDYGKYYMLGGSAIKDNFNMFGVDNPLSVVNFDALKTLEEDLQQLGHHFDAFTSLTREILENPIESSPKEQARDCIYDLCARFHARDLEGGWVSINDEYEMQDDFVLLENGHDFNRAIDVLLDENKKCLKKALEILTQIESIPDRGLELKRIQRHLIKVILTIDDYNNTVKSLNAFVEASLTHQDEEKALKGFLQKVRECSQRNKAFSSEWESLASLELGTPAALEEASMGVLSIFFKELQAFSRAIGGSLATQSGGVVDSGFVGMFVPGNFRDMDFVFKSSDGERSAGRRLFLQMATLAYRWEQYKAERFNDESIPRYSPEEVPHFAAFIPRGFEDVESIPVREDDTPVIRLMKEPMRESNEVSTIVPAFDLHRQVDKEGQMQVFFSGPEQPNKTSEFRAEALKQINEAEEEIVINHMYFHPTDDLKDALVDAANRGVKIKIITCGIHSRCPNGQLIFAPRNKYNFATLVRALPQEKRENVEVYEFTQDKKGLHKKVMVFDRKRVLAGSSNFGYKSLETSSDHEVNFLATAPQFAEETYRVCDLDMKLSQRVEDPSQLGYRDYYKASTHRLMAPLIG